MKLVILLGSWTQYRCVCVEGEGFPHPTSSTALNHVGILQFSSIRTLPETAESAGGAPSHRTASQKPGLGYLFFCGRAVTQKLAWPLPRILINLLERLRELREIFYSLGCRFIIKGTARQRDASGRVRGRGAAPMPFQSLPPSHTSTCGRSLELSDCPGF